MNFTTILLLSVIAAPVAAGDLTLVKLSQDLFQTGMAQRDPLLIAAAAKLRQGLEFSISDRRANDSTGDVLPFLLANDPSDVATWYDLARLAAADNADMLAIIDDAEAEGGRGVITGQEYAVGTLAAGGSDFFRDYSFEGGKYAEVYVEPNEGQNLDLLVRDKSGTVVCQDLDASPVAYCAWTPAETGAFTVEIINQGPDHAGYAFMTN